MLVVAAIVSITLFYAFVAVLAFAVEQGLVDLDQSDAALEGLAIIGVFIAYLILTFISTFFSTALVRATYDVFSGKSPSTSRSLKAATGAIGPILIWSVAAATMGVILRLVERRVPSISFLFSMAWAALTFFIVPVIALERTSATGMFKKSGKTFKETWGESATGATGVGIVQAVILLAGGGLTAGVWMVIGISQLLIGMGATTVLLAFLVGLTVGGVVKTALYLYVRGDELPDEFDDIDPDNLISETENAQSQTSSGDINPGSGQI